jgi:FkbM family methyltransferase
MPLFKDVAKRLRASPALNRPATSVLRRVASPGVRERLVVHLPRVGPVRIDTPAGPVRMWSGDDWLTSRLWWRGFGGYEGEEGGPFIKFAASARAVLDVGSMTGWYALLAARSNPAARVYAFEANPSAAAALGRNLALNPDLAVTVIPYAVSDRRGSAEFHLGGPGLTSASSLGEHFRGQYRTVPVATLDLDSFCDEWGVQHVDLVKIDVEGTEPAVIAGMARVLERDRPVIFLEVLNGDDPAYKSLAASLVDDGYRLFHLTPDRVIEESEFAAPNLAAEFDDMAVNHLCCPRERVPAWLEQTLPA